MIPLVIVINTSEAPCIPHHTASIDRNVRRGPDVDRQRFRSFEEMLQSSCNLRDLCDSSKIEDSVVQTVRERGSRMRHAAQSRCETAGNIGRSFRVARVAWYFGGKGAFEFRLVRRLLVEGARVLFDDQGELTGGLYPRSKALTVPPTEGHVVRRARFPL